MNNKCAHCGQALPKDTLFCSSCGTKQNSVVVQSEEEKSAKTLNDPEENKGVSLGSVAHTVASNISKKNALFWGVLIVLGVGLVYFLAKDSPEESAFALQQRQQEQQRNYVQRYVDSKYKEVVDRAYDGGRSISWDIKNWQYSQFKNEYIIDLRLSWAGSITNNQYIAQGTFRIKNVGTDSETWSWEPSWQNANLKRYLANKRDAQATAVGVAIIAGMLEAISNN